MRKGEIGNTLELQSLTVFMILFRDGDSFSSGSISILENCGIQMVSGNTEGN